MLTVYTSAKSEGYLATTELIKELVLQLLLYEVRVLILRKAAMEFDLTVGCSCHTFELQRKI